MIGVGTPLAEGLGRPIAGLRAFPGDVPPFPSTQHALWVWVAHGDASRLFDAGRALAGRFRGLLDVVDEIDAFGYREGRDLSGFVDGTENPKGDDAVRAAIIAGRGAGLDGGSFVAVQRWVHDSDAVDRLTAAARAAAVGRDHETDVELADAPVSAHVKRTAQESFDPPPTSSAGRCPTAASASTASTSSPSASRSTASSGSCGEWRAATTASATGSSRSRGPSRARTTSARRSARGVADLSAFGA